MDVGPTALCREVWISYESGKTAEPTHALRGVSTALFPGEFVSVVGPSGSGKSSLLHAIAGFTRPSQGQTILLGTDISRARQSAVARVHRRGVGVIFQSLNLVPSLPVVENVLLPSRFAHTQIDKDRANSILRHLGLGHRLEHRTSALSGGEQQRVALARILYSPPALLLADEPTGALDTQATGLVLSHLRDLARNGTTVMLVTHDLEAGALADRALVMRDGRIVREIDAPQTHELLDSASFSAGLTSEDPQADSPAAPSSQARHE